MYFDNIELYIDLYTLHGLEYTMDIPRIYHGSTADIPRIYADLPRIYRGYTADIPQIDHGYTAEKPRIYRGSTTDIPRTIKLFRL